MLKNALNSCFSSRKEFSKYSIPLLLEKFSSSNEEAQQDALDIFFRCSKTTYDPNDYKEYVEALWSFFQRTVMNASKSDLEEAALCAIEALAFSFSRSVQDGNVSMQPGVKMLASYDSFIEKAMQDCIKYLNEPDLKLVWPGVKCLHALARASSTSNQIVMKKIIPILLEYYKATTFVSS